MPSIHSYFHFVCLHQLQFYSQVIVFKTIHGLLNLINDSITQGKLVSLDLSELNEGSLNPLVYVQYPIYAFPIYGLLALIYEQDLLLY